MLATGLFLTSSSTFVTLMLCWLLSVSLVVGLFLYNRHRILSGERGQ